MKSLIVGTRGSSLSLAQTRIVTERLAALLPELQIEVRTIKTKGDIYKEEKLDKMEQSGVFVKEIDRQLMKGTIDIAVHSLKDIPTKQPPTIKIAAIVERADPRDVLVSRDGIRLRDLPKNAKVGTSSLRRKGQLLAFRNDLDVVEMRGNVDSRIAKLDAGEYDAIVLAAAGMGRLGLSDRIVEYMPLETMLPAPGQGALAVEIKEGNREVEEIVAKIDDVDARLSTLAERTVLSRIGGGCSVLLGVLATVGRKRIGLRARITSEDGKRSYDYEHEGSAEFPEESGLTLAEKILMSGASDLVGDRKSDSALNAKIVVVTREEEPGEGICQILMEKGAIPVYFPTIRTEKLDTRKYKAPASLDQYNFIIITSKRSVESLSQFANGKRLPSGTKLVAIGDETKKELEEYGFPVDHVPADPYAESISKDMGALEGKRVLIINSARAQNRLADDFASNGASVDRVTPYTTRQRSVSDERKSCLLGYASDFVTFASPSAVEGFIGILGGDAKGMLSKTRVVCIGDTTAMACKKAGVPVSVIAKNHSLEGMALEMERELEYGADV
jgi:hydroxymethylbilane synthase